MKEKNMLDTLQLLRDVYDDDYKRNIVINLFNDQHRSRVLSEYFYKALYKIIVSVTRKSSLKWRKGML